MAHSPARRIALIVIVSLLAVPLSGCSAIGRAVIDQLGGGQQGGDEQEWSGDEGDSGDGDYITHDSGNTDFDDVAVGMCVDEEGLSGVDYYASVDVVDCTLPHYAELYSLFEVAGDDYPGDDTASDLADAGCGERFSDYVGSTWEKSEYDYITFYPGEDNWADGDHGVVCYIVDYDFEQLYGSAKNGEI